MKNKKTIEDREVICNSGCKAKFLLSQIKPRQRQVEEKDQVIRVFFCCPKCGHEYTAYYEDSQVRIWQQMKFNSKDLSLRSKLQEKINERMIMLKDKFE